MMERPSGASRLRDAMALGGLARIASIIGPLLLVPVATRVLGPVGYGIYAMAGIAAAFAPVFDLGLRYALVTRLAPPLTTGDQAAARRLSTTTLLALVVLGAVLGPIAAVVSLALPLDQLLPLTRSQGAVLGECLAIVAVAYALQLPLSVGMTLLLAAQRFKQYWFWTGITPVVVVAAGTCSLLLSGDVRLLSLTTFGAPAVVMVVPALIVLRERGWRPCRADLSLDSLRSLTQLGPVNSLATLLVAAFSQVDRILVQVFLGPGPAGIYTVAQRMIAIPQQTLTMATQPLWPAFGSALAEGRHEWIRRTMTKGQLVMVGIGIVGAVAFVLVGDPLILLVAGSEFHTSWQVRAALGLWLIAILPLAPVAMLLNAAGVRLAILVPPVLGVVLAVGIGSAAVPRLGETGAALAAAIGTGLGGTIPLTWYARRLMARGVQQAPPDDAVSPGFP